MERNLYYVLVDKKAVPATNLIQWGHFYGNFENRRVAFETIGGIDISTVFLGLDHNHWSEGPPILFETMVFNGKMDQDTFRCSTWEEAEEQHKKVVEMVKASFN